MNNEWTLREEIHRFAHNWPLIVIFFMAGALIGYGITFLLPSSYRAETSLHVSFNGDVYPRNPDDYKNWHLQELEDLVTSDPVIQETLNRLRSQDAYWDAVDIQWVVENVNLYWRNAGEWRLVVESPTPERASDLVETWQQVILETVDIASGHAQNMLTLNAHIGSTATAQVETGLMIAELTALREALLTWKENALQAGSSTPLDTLDRWSLLALVSRPAGLDAAGRTLLEETPAYDTPAQEYIIWIDQALKLLEQQLVILENQSEALTNQQEELQQALTAELEASLGTSAYLTVQPLPPESASSYPVRPASQTAFIGGMIGLLVWMVIWLALPYRKTLN